jgi:16S rRNA (cytidine1402-2'-O)-methyltransferase
MNDLKPSTLYIIATPIGNMEDMTARGMRALAECDVLYAEDTRVTRKLIDRYEIKKSLFSYRESAGPGLVQKTISEIIFHLKEGKTVGYVSDAGTPGISDPGSYLVSRVREEGFDVLPIPGVSALATLLSAAGFPSQRPLFVGFLPKKKGHQTLMGKLESALDSGVCDTIVLYESPERIIKLLEELKTWKASLRVCVGRELTKLHEELLVGTTDEVYEKLRAKTSIKGEISLAICKE